MKGAEIADGHGIISAFSFSCKCFVDWFKFLFRDNAFFTLIKVHFYKFIIRIFKNILSITV